MGRTMKGGGDRVLGIDSKKMEVIRWYICFNIYGSSADDRSVTGRIKCPSVYDGNGDYILPWQSSVLRKSS